MRSDLPSPRAASGNFLEPNRMTTTMATIAQCHRLKPPVITTSKCQTRTMLPDMSESVSEQMSCSP
ncbi:hypothetical protein EF834_09055 [Rhodococcus spongiicola]|uniref:Uncharacterized protein n=1 Tax=Rhodococcus spongiicola TaxID=2487352 RepID=A0A3S3AL71_9NOCA|nr:hypothetical protein EF834_09055 [Rhodococcus spongiicola]